MKILKFARFQQEPVRDGRALLTIKFLDNDSNLYSWAPRWKDMNAAFLRALNVEGFNKPESEWLNRFAHTVKDVAEGVSQPIQDARKVNGTLLGVEERMLQISCDGDYGEYTETVTPGFAITYDFLDEWIGRGIETLTINGIAVSVKGTKNPYFGVEYPPKDVSGPDIDREPPW